MSNSKYHRRKSRKFRKSRKNRTRRHYPHFKRLFNARGTSQSPISPKANVPCCMCDHKFPRDTMFTPSRCLQTHRERAHKICEECWWDPQIGFAKEDTTHSCPGCKRGQPLNPPLKIKEPIVEEIIVISD